MKKSNLRGYGRPKNIIIIENAGKPIKITKVYTKIYRSKQFEDVNIVIARERVQIIEEVALKKKKLKIYVQ